MMQDCEKENYNVKMKKMCSFPFVKKVLMKIEQNVFRRFLSKITWSDK